MLLKCKKRTPSFRYSLFFVLFFPACSLGPKYLVQNFQAPNKVAVLPFSNETNDVGAPETVRKLLIEMLPGSGYHPSEEKKVDETLVKKFGITEGGQLNSATAQNLGQTLGVDGLFYGNVINFVDFPFDFGRKRTVKANVKLVDAKTGNLLWEDEKSWTTPEIHLNAEEAKRAAIRQVAERQFEKMAGTFLERESRMVISLMLRNLPRGQ